MANLVRSSLILPTCSTARQHRNRGKHVLAALQRHQQQTENINFATKLSRREALLGVLAGSVALGSWTSSPGQALAAKAAKEEKQPTIVNDPALLKTQLEAQYSQWAAGQFDAWLAGQPETLKWQTTYNGGPVMKLKGRAGAAQYWATLQADLDIKSYKPLAIFVDNDGDEATVVVEAAGTSRRTLQPFTTIFLHSYTIGPGGQVLKFKELTDTAVMAQLVPPPAPASVAGMASAPAPASGSAVSVAGEEPPVVEPGSTARSA